MFHYNLHPLFKKYKLIEYRNITSTQDKIKGKIKEKEDLYIVKANIQTKGRGRYGKKWESPEGGLWFSFNTKKEVDEDKFLIEVSLSLIKTLSKFKRGFQLKYPNDVIYKGKKIAGILIEVWRNYYITGIGINVNNTEYPKNGVSLYEIVNRKEKIDLNQIVLSFFENLEKKEISFTEYKKLLIQVKK